MYTAHRDYRFEYVDEIIAFIEERQCVDCAFKSDRDDYPMCLEIEAQLIEEEPVPALDDKGNDGVVCTRYRLDVLEEEAHPDQLRIFDNED